MLDRVSSLGGPKIEGIVLKNYSERAMIGSLVLPLMAGKYVSEAFKEVHKKEWKTGKDRKEILLSQYHTEARWEKAIQHLRDSSVLTNSPKDIGPLIQEIHRDIEEECRQEIMEQLWSLHKRELMGRVTSGFPEWYKRKLIGE